MKRNVGPSNNVSPNITFNVSDASPDEVVIATTGNKKTSSAKPPDVDKKQRNEIKNELFNLSKEVNLVIIIVYGMYCFNWYLMGAQWLSAPNWKPEIECEIADLSNVTWSFYEKRNITSPDDDVYLPGCTYYDYDYLLLSMLEYHEAVEEALEQRKNTPILKCENYKIKHDIPKEITHTREFNIFCMKRSMQFTKVYMHMGGCIFGFPVGILADIYGRRPVHLYCTILFCLSAFVISFSINFIMYAVLTVILGGTLYSINIILAIIFLELYRNKFKTFLLMVSFSWWHISFQHSEGIYNIVEVWRLRKLIVALLTLICVFFAITITPESPRFLMTNRQFKTAWEWLHELGSSERSDVQNFEPPKVNLKYQLTVFAKLLFQQRTYIVILLNGTGSFFLHFFFRNMKRNIIKISTRLRLQFLVVQVMVICFTAGLTFVHSRKTAMCIYYILMSLCILTNMFSRNEVIIDVAGHAGNMLSAVLYILSYTYIMETFPTSHRATCMGFYLTSIKLVQALLEMYVFDVLVWEHNDLFPTVYCGICMICALITLMLPESCDDIPDRKEDLRKSLALDSSY